MKVNKKIVCKKILDNDVLIDISNNSNILKLNETSAFIFELIKDNYSIEEIINKVTEEYDVDLIKASSDVCKFIEKLEKLNVIKQWLK